MAILNIFANFFIDRAERFLRMQDSFRSFKDISADKWVINVRGRYAEQTLAFLRSHIGDKLVGYKLHSKEGWFHDTRQMLPDINGDYVLFWLEDHINLADVKVLDNIVIEMKEKRLDIMLYTFWQNGRLRQRYNGVDFISGNYIDYFEHNVNNNRIIQNNPGGSYLIAIPSILSQKLFKKVVVADDPIPKRWPKETPFDFEKAPNDTQWLPLKVALPRQELFASIDCDHGHEGYCLQSRGLYPVREERQSYALPTGTGARIFLSLKNKCRCLESDIKFLIRLAVNPAQFKHVLRWIKSRRKEHLHQAPVPWMVFDAIDFINSHLAIGARIFEYGSGDSTLFWLSRGAQVVSVEHDPVYFAKLRKIIGAHNLLEYSLVEPQRIQNSKDRNPSNPDDYVSSNEMFAEHLFSDYVSQIDKFPDNSFDMVVIDGRARPSCIKHSIKKVKIGGLLVLDDSDRKYYLEEAAVFLNNYDHAVFRGVKPGLALFAETSVFIRRA